MTSSRLSSAIANIGVGTVALCAIVVTGLIARRELGTPSRVEPPRISVVRGWRELSQDGQRMGARDAPVTILTFSDFQCPYCAQLARTLTDLRRKSSVEIAIVYRHFPLQSIHPFAFAAAHASECAAKAGQFEPFHDALYHRQDSIGIKPWTRFATEAGVVDTAAFQRCLGDTTIALRIRSDEAAGARLGVTGTPTVLVNDRLVPVPTYRILDSLISDIASSREGRPGGLPRAGVLILSPNK